jgi:hypothetical protein
LVLMSVVTVEKSSAAAVVGAATVNVTTIFFRTRVNDASTMRQSECNRARCRQRWCESTTGARVRGPRRALTTAA